MCPYEYCCRGGEDDDDAVAALGLLLSITSSLCDRGENTDVAGGRKGGDSDPVPEGVVLGSKSYDNLPSSTEP